MNFESYTERIRVLREIDSKRTEKKIIQTRLQVKNTQMKMTSVKKVQFASLNDNDIIFWMELFPYLWDIRYYQIHKN